jgi:hypothetical protein
VAPSYSAAAAIIDGDQVLVVDVKSLVPEFETSFPQTKFPGGKEEKKDRGDPFRTMIREVRQETGLKIPLKSPRVILCRISVTPEHYRIFYLVRREDCQGEIKTTKTLDTKSLLSPPLWKPIEEVGRILYETHQPALLEILNRIEVGV